MFLESGIPYGKLSILLFSVLKLKSLSDSISTESMQCSSTTATPSKISCMISGGSPDVTWKNFRVFSMESRVTPYVVLVRLAASPCKLAQ